MTIRSQKQSFCQETVELPVFSTKPVHVWQSLYPLRCLARKKVARFGFLFFPWGLSRLFLFKNL